MKGALDAIAGGECREMKAEKEEELLLVFNRSGLFVIKNYYFEMHSLLEHRIIKLENEFTTHLNSRTCENCIKFETFVYAFIHLLVKLHCSCLSIDFKLYLELLL